MIADLGARGAPRVRFTDGRRPESAVVVRTEGFEGPLALLLSLIEARQLDVLSVSLGDLAGAYLEALGDLEGDHMAHVSAFVAVAAQLILIKSRALLPAQPSPEPIPADDAGDDPEEELRARLIRYRAFRDAGRWLASRLEEGFRLSHREAGRAAASAAAGAGRQIEEPLDAAILPGVLIGLSAVAPPPPARPGSFERRVTLAERAAVIRAALARAPRIVLQELLVGVTDRAVAAVTFLALLELVKRREVSVEQERPWGPIRCRLLASGSIRPLGDRGQAS